MATKPFDVSKFRKSITKSIDGISVGFNDPTDWISTNNFALNYLISGDFNRGIPMGKVTVFAGESGAGKSYICSGNIVKNAQAQGIYPILIDTENALDEAWLHALGVDTSEDKLLKLNMAMIDDVAKMISEFVKEYKTLAEDARPKVVFVLDSLGMLLPSRRISLGHFNCTGTSRVWSTSAKATPTANGNPINSCAACGMGQAMENISILPGSELQLRPARPRPAV